MGLYKILLANFVSTDWLINLEILYLHRTKKCVGVIRLFRFIWFSPSKLCIHTVYCLGATETHPEMEFLNNPWGARNREGIGLSYPYRWNRFLGSLKVKKKFRTLELWKSSWSHEGSHSRRGGSPWGYGGSPWSQARKLQPGGMEATGALEVHSEAVPRRLFITALQWIAIAQGPKISQKNEL